MEDDYVFIDLVTHLVYCCHIKHVCFSNGGTQELASRICSERIRFGRHRLGENDHERQRVNAAFSIPPGIQAHNLVQCNTKK